MRDGRQPAAPPLDGGCQIWWAEVGDARPAHEGLLDQHDVRRRARLARVEDRQRLLVGAALARTVLAVHLRCSPSEVRLDRTCRFCAGQHGKPRVLGGDGMELSVSHSGARVVVAVARRHPVGVDVEQVDPRVDLDSVTGHVLTPIERRCLAGSPEVGRRERFFRYWTRKESVLKATGDGLRVPLRDLTMSAPDERPELQNWRGRPDLPARVSLFDLEPGAGFNASLAVLDASDLDVTQHDGSNLL